MPVGVTHTDNSNPVPVSYWLSPDMMGTPRRILTRDATLTQVGRLVMDPWGAAVLLPDNSRNVGTGSIPARVWLPHRLPGQLQGQFEPFVDNQHRMYFPDARSYLSADPEHGSSAMTPGPQAYTYANGNPFKFVDPTGRIPNEKDFYFSVRAAALDSASWAAGLTRLGMERSQRFEFGAAICECCGSSKFYSTKLGRGTARNMVTIPPCKAGDKSVSEIHSHPTMNVLSSDDQKHARYQGLEHFAAFPDGSFVGYTGSTTTDSGPGAIDINEYKMLLESGSIQQAEILRYQTEALK
jgi:RHS repeat-associated protein